MILVTGGSGFVGSHLLRRLAAEGTPACGMVREAAAARLPDGVQARQADLTRFESLTAALAGITTVIHAAAITGNLKEPYAGAYDRVNRAGTENLMRAAKEAGVERVVLLSGLGTRPAPAGSYMATRWAMEEAVRGGGIPWQILQPSVLFGDGAEFVAALARLARTSPVLPVLGSGELRFQPLWIEDLVTCLVASAGDAFREGEAIPLGGSEFVTFRQIVRTICRVLKLRRALVPLPLPIARVQARLMAIALPNPPLVPATLELFSFENATQLDAVDRNFGFHPAGFTEHLERMGVEELTGPRSAARSEV